MKAVFKSDISGISEICMGKLVYGDPDAKIETVTTDSRNTGEKNLFIPLVGEKFDGHTFIRELADKEKIQCYLTMQTPENEVSAGGSVGCIRCDNTLYALGRIGSYRRQDVNPHVIGITGTNGKTTVKELLHAIISKKWKTLKNEKNYNNEIGVPFTFLGLEDDHRMAIIEMGMNHRGEIGRLAGIAAPDTAVITNAGEGHLEFLGSTEGVALSKIEIIEGMKPGSVLFLNADTDHFLLMKKKAEDKGIQVKTFGLKPNSDNYPENFSLSGRGLSFHYNDETFSAPLYGKHNMYNVIAAVAVSSWLKVDAGAIKSALAEFENVDGRSQVIDRGYIIINDTYNSNPLSSRFALESVSCIYPDKRKIAVLSDMKELGGLSESLHMDTGRFVAENGFDLLLVWGEMSEYYIKGAADAGLDNASALIFKSKDDLIDYINSHAESNDVILVKGSRSMKMEEVVNLLKGTA